ncbi:hypothetical protein ACTMTU_09055 [Streptomyces sp. OZ13]|uniref:hypothetical protein n=1 Tax=Streptomyces sp. OZ13 TaxID=3452210 RepID=UPI003F8CBAB8
MDIAAAKNGNLEAIAGLLGTFETQIARVAAWASLDSFEGDSAEGLARHATRAASLAVSEADEHAWFTELEFSRVSRKLEALYASQKAGDASQLTRQRVARLEALQKALMGWPGTLAN